MKKKIREWLINQDYEAIIELAGRNRRTLSFLEALTYDPEPLVCWRAIEAIGLAAARQADQDAELVRIHLRRMQWLLNDESGGIGWHFPEAMAEIIYNRPDQFAEFIPIVISLFDLEEEDVVPFRPGILWAVGRLAQVAPESVQIALPQVISCLADPNPQTRGMAVWCLGQLEAGEYIPDPEKLLQDDGPVEFYSEGQLVSGTVADLTRELA